MSNLLDDDKIVPLRDGHFNSPETRKYLRSLNSCFSDNDYNDQLDSEYYNSNKKISLVNYKQENIMPLSLIENKEWQDFNAPKDDEHEVSEVAQIKFEKRNHDQRLTVVNWLTKKWPTAYQMGKKKCMMMTKVLKYFQYKPNESIITEGDRGLTFYIIINGITDVHKDGVGVVAQLGPGKSFGEIALSGKDLRTASVIAKTAVEIFSLHKLDYDRFVKDIQSAERREHFNFYKNNINFSDWTRDRLERLSNSSYRKSYEAGDIIYHQNDKADYFYFIYEGSVKIIKEIEIINRNKWPVGMESWTCKSTKGVKDYTIAELNKGAAFGEHCVLGKNYRLTRAIAITKVQLLCVDKLEMKNLLKLCTKFEYNRIIDPKTSSWDDTKLLVGVGTVQGGPSSTATSGDITILPNLPKNKKPILRTKVQSKLSFEQRATLFSTPSVRALKSGLYEIEKDNQVKLRSEEEVISALKAADNIENLFSSMGAIINSNNDYDTAQAAYTEIKTSLNDPEKVMKMGLGGLIANRKSFNNDDDNNIRNNNDNTDIISRERPSWLHSNRTKSMTFVLDQFSDDDDDDDDSNNYRGINNRYNTITTTTGTTMDHITSNLNDTKINNNKKNNYNNSYESLSSPSVIENRRARLHSSVDSDIMPTGQVLKEAEIDSSKLKSKSNNMFNTFTNTNSNTNTNSRPSTTGGIDTTNKKLKLFYNTKKKNCYNQSTKSLIFSPVQRKLTKKNPKINFNIKNERKTRPFSALVIKSNTITSAGQIRTHNILLNVKDLDPPLEGYAYKKPNK